MEEKLHGKGRRHGKVGAGEVERHEKKRGQATGMGSLDGGSQQSWATWKRGQAT